MAPGVTTDLVTFGIHALNDGRIAGFGIIDLPFSTIVADNEESCFDIVGFENVKQVRSPDIWPVVECESNFARYGAMSNVNAVWKVSQRKPRNRGGIGT